MFLRTKLTPAALMLGLIISAGAYVQAQQTATQNPKERAGRTERRERGFRRERGSRGAMGPRMLRQLDLTEAQKEQVHAIVKQTFEGNRATREELRKLGEKRREGALSADDEARARMLHQQMRAAMTETKGKIEAVLTADQKAKAAELMKERKAGFERGGGRRREFRDQLRQGNRPPAKPNQ
jgi:Spy/CpxP family protein refolding chaperone